MGSSRMEDWGIIGSKADRKGARLGPTIGVGVEEYWLDPVIVSDMDGMTTMGVGNVSVDVSLAGV